MRTGALGGKQPGSVFVGTQHMVGMGEQGWACPSEQGSLPLTWTAQCSEDGPGRGGPHSAPGPPTPPQAWTSDLAAGPASLRSTPHQLEDGALDALLGLLWGRLPVPLHLLRLV